MASRRKTRRVKKIKKALLNTTIKVDVLDKFHDICKDIGVPMNLLIEAFMEQFVAGEFKIRIGRNKLGQKEIDVQYDD